MRKSWIILTLILASIQVADAQVVRTVTNLFDSGKGTLRDVIGLCTSGDTVRFSVTGTITLTNGSISFNSGIYIDGPGADSITVNGGAKYTVFNITGGDVTIKGITIDNAEPYGVLYNAKSNTLTIEDCAITNCKNESSQGPGVYVASSKYVSINGTEFKGNSIYGDGRSRVYGGALYLAMSDSAEVNHCLFENNQAASVNWGGTGSDAEGYGGAVYVRGPKLDMRGTQFINNSASGGGCCGYRPNWSKALGGALYFSGSKLNVDSCLFERNRISSSDFRSYNLNQGNALFLQSVDSVEISNSVFRSNTSGGGNYVNLYGGCIYASLNNYLGISNTVISSNSSREIGALCIDATTDGKGKVVLNQVKIDSNSQSTGNYVSAAFFRDIAQVEIVDSRISDNKGAGVWTKDVGNFQITGSLLDSNKTYHVYLNNPSGSNNRFLNNTFRKSQNKAIYLDNTSSNYVTNNTFVNNTGDVYLKNASAEFKNNIFTYDKFISDAFSRSSTEVPISSGGNIVKGSSFKNYFTKSNDINTRDPQLDRFGWHGGYTQTYSLSSKSDAIDLGGKDSIRYDQRGYVRDSLTDAGAFEFGALDPFIISVDTIIAQTDYCIGDSMKLEVRVTGMVDEYAWYKNGRLVTGQTSSVYRVDSVTSLDSASYKCIVSNAKNSDSTKLVQINVFEYPLVIASGADTICTGDSAALSVSGAENYTWRHNAGDSAHIWVSPMGTTTYSVQGESNGCVRFDSVVISVDTTPTVKITGKDTICVGDSVELIADGADSYTWHHASGDDAKRMEKPVQTTTYRVTGTTKSCSSSDSITVTVNPNPVLSVHNDTSICAGEHLWLWARGAQNFSWKPSVADSSYIKVQPNVTTSYEVTGITNGCSSSETIEVGVRPSPDVSILATDTALCDSGSVILSAKGANSYVWADGLGSASSVVVKPKVTTTYAVTGSKDGCTNMASRVVYVFTSPDPPIIKNNDVLETGFYSDYQWRWNGEDIQGATERTYEPYKNGDYTVRVTEENGCEGESTAKITIDDLVGVADPEGLKPRIYPNPNSGSFTLDLNGLGQVETITIYNGQGQKVYQRDQIDTILLELRLHDLSPGLYRLVVQGETQSVNTSFVLK